MPNPPVATTGRSERCRIEILGAVRAWRNGHELDLGSPQQRGVLSLLVVAEDQPVRTHEIVDALWGVRPPRSAVNVVQTYVKRLRHVLEPERARRDPSRILPVAGGGYLLRVAPDLVDLWQFRRLVRLALEARRTAEHYRVVSLLTRALTLWKGPPGGSLPPLAGRHRLWNVAEEQRQVVGWLTETSLAVGAAAEAIPAVVVAAAARPLDEQLHADLIRLYHAAGRRSDGVRVFLESQQRLREQLGLDAGTALCGAYQAVLRDRREGPFGGSPPSPERR